MSEGPRKHERLIYDGIELLSADTPGDESPEFQFWHLPGGGVATTEKLLRIANTRRVNVSRLTTQGLDRVLESLN